MSTVLSTERLRLRAQTTADVDAITAGLGDFEVTRYLTVVPFPYSRKDAEDWTSTLNPPRPEAAVFSIDLEGVGMIGTVTLVSELGYWLGEPFWGKGYMTEAARAARPISPTRRTSTTGSSRGALRRTPLHSTSSQAWLLTAQSKAKAKKADPAERV